MEFGHTSDVNERNEPDMKHLRSNAFYPRNESSDSSQDSLGPQREISLGDVIAGILDHRRTVILITGFFVLAGLFYLSVRDHHFVANSQILIDPVGIQVLDRDVAQRSESSDGGAAVVESQMQVLTSESVLRQVIINENLVNDPEFLDPNGSILGTIVGGLTSWLRTNRDAPDPENEVLFELQKAVYAFRPQRSYIVNLFVQSQNPKKAAHLANVISKTYIEAEVEARSGLARRASGTLGARLAELRLDLTRAESAVERYKSSHNIINSNGSPINEQELEQLNKAMVDAENRVALARSNLQQIEQARSSATDLGNVPEALSSSTISGLRIRLASALQRRSVLSADLLPSHPSMASVDAQVDVVLEQIKLELARIVGRAKAELDRALTDQTQILVRLGAIKKTTYVANDAHVRLRELIREADAKRAVYEAFLLRSKELGEQQGVDTTRARIISNAVPPLRPSDMSSVLVMAAALILGLGFGTLVALARGFFPFPTAPNLKLRPFRGTEPAAPASGRSDHKPAAEPGDEVEREPGPQFETERPLGEKPCRARTPETELHPDAKGDFAPEHVARSQAMEARQKEIRPESDSARAPDVIVLPGPVAPRTVEAQPGTDRPARGRTRATKGRLDSVN